MCFIKITILKPRLYQCFKNGKIVKRNQKNPLFNKKIFHISNKPYSIIFEIYY